MAARTSRLVVCILPPVSAEDPQPAVAARWKTVMAWPVRPAWWYAAAAARAHPRGDGEPAFSVLVWRDLATGSAFA